MAVDPTALRTCRLDRQGDRRACPRRPREIAGQLSAYSPTPFTGLQPPTGRRFVCARGISWRRHTAGRSQRQPDTNVAQISPGFPQEPTVLGPASPKRKRPRPSGNPSQRCSWACRNPGCDRKGRFDNRRHDRSPNERWRQVATCRQNCARNVQATVSKSTKN